MSARKKKCGKLKEEETANAPTNCNALTPPDAVAWKNLTTGPRSNFTLWEDETINALNRKPKKMTFALTSDDVAWHSLTTNELVRCGIAALVCLEQRAGAGDANAAQEMYNLTHVCVDSVETLTRVEAGELRRLLKSASDWPVFFPARKKSQNALAAKMAALGFATNCELNAFGKWDEDSPITKCVLEIFDFVSRLRKDPRPGVVVAFHGGFRPKTNELWTEWVNENASKLPKSFTKEKARKWADLCEPLLSIFWGEKFETHTDFAKYTGVKELNGAGPENRLRGKITPGITRGEILRMWRQSWRSLARHESAVGTRA